MASSNVFDLSAAANVQQQPVVGRQFTTDELKTMNQCKHHANIVIEALNELEQTGSTKHQFLPAFPRKKLLDIMCGSESQSKPLLGTELHVYLQSKIVYLDGDDFVIPDVVDINLNTTMDQIATYLKNSVLTLNNNRGRILHASFRFGKILKECQYVYNLYKGAGRVNVTWCEFLKQTINISNSYAHQLITLYDLFGTFPKMHRLYLPVTELYRRRNEIQYMLLSDAECKRFWAEQ